MSTLIEETDRISGSLGRCILPLLDALGWYGEKRTFINSLPYNYSNFDIYDLATTVANLGFKVNHTNGNLDDLDVRLLPCLGINEQGEPIVFVGYENGEFYGFEGKSSSFKNIPVNAEPYEFHFFDSISTTIINSEMPQRSWFIKFIERFKTHFIISFILSFLLTLTALSSPLIVMGIYQKIGNAQKMNGFWIVGIGILGVLCVDLTLRMFRRNILSEVGARMGYLVTTQVFKRIFSFSPTSTENASVGAQIVRLRDFSSVRAFIDGSGIISLMELPFLIILFIALIIMGGSLAFIPVVAALLLIMLSIGFVPSIKKSNSESASSGSKKQEFLIEVFSEFKEIRVSGLSKQWLHKFENISSTSATDTLKVANVNALLNTVSQGVVQIAGTLTIGLGVYLVLNGELSGAVLIAAMMLVWKILSPITTGFSVFSQSVRIKKSIDQLDRLMSMPLEIISKNSEAIKFNGNISFQGVSMRYKPDYFPAVSNIEFNINSNEFVVLSGHDGSGKTTFLKLLIGMYKPQVGTITIDGTNIQQYPPSILRRSITYLPQEDVLFNMSILENLKAYSPTVSEQHLKATLDWFGLLEEINLLPNGLNTDYFELKSRDDFISLRRRICIARTMLNSSQIILLDEPERGLKEKDIDLFISKLVKLKLKKTIVISSNHPKIKALADKLITFNMGNIVDISQAASIKDENTNQVI